MRHATTMLLVVALLGLFAAPTLHAEDEPTGDSAAERAYRDAWWAETSAGALDRALEGYRKAVDADGPASVRAQALYRMAVVLERIGKTDDAIRAMEQLAKDFSDEADLLAQARDRLEEWTAVDLRTDFASWYERYKYSPEFQGRIVELVLKLGGPSDDAVNAGRELLVIGKAAVPALRAHLDSPNAQLRDHAVDLLLQLGEYPSAAHLVETGRWRRTADGWGRVLRAPEDVRTRLLAELEDVASGGESVELLRAVLEGPSGWARAVARRPSSYLVRAVLDADPGDAVLAEIRNLVPKLEPALSGMLANLLLYNDVVPDHVALSWLQVDGAREQVAQRIASGELRDANAWRAVVEAMNALPVGHSAMSAQNSLFRALSRAVSDAPASADLTPAVRAIERGTFPINQIASHRAPSEPVDVPAVSRLLVRAVDEARDPGLAEDAVKTWTDLHRGDEDASLQLLTWARRPTTPEVTSRAAKYAGLLATDSTLAELLAAMADAAPELAAEFAEGLRSNRRLLNLAWSDERVLKLHDLARAFDGSNATREIGRLFYALHKAPALLDQLTRLALQAPTRVWGGATRSIDKTTVGLLKQPGRAADVRAGFREAWPGWDPEERLAALDLLRRIPWSAFTDESLASFLRAQLAGQWAVRGDAPNEALERQGKRRILEVLPTLTLDDVRQVFDLEDPEQAAAAAGLARLEKDAEAYDALAAARRAHDPKTRWAYWSQWVGKGPGDLRRRVARDLAKDPHASHRAKALRDLAVFRNGEDVPLLVEALGDVDAEVRTVAAEMLVRVYDRTAIQALVKALDDPSPEVRDQALATLEAIKQIEEKKDYWRKFAEGNR